MAIESNYINRSLEGSSFEQRPSFSHTLEQLWETFFSRDEVSFKQGTSLQDRVSLGRPESREEVEPPKEVLKTASFAHQKIESSSWLVTGSSLEFIYFMGNISSIYRMGSELGAFFGGSVSAPLNGALGLTSGGALFTGFVHGCRGYQQLETAKKIHDVCGKILAKIKMVRGAFESLNGAVFIPYRILCATSEKIRSPSADHVRRILGYGGLSCLGITLFLSGLPSIACIFKGRSWKADLKTEMRAGEELYLQKGLEFVMSPFYLTQEEKQEGISRVLKMDLGTVEGDRQGQLSEADQMYIRNLLGEVKEETLCQIQDQWMAALKRKEAELIRAIGEKGVEILKENGIPMMERYFREGIFDLAAAKTLLEAVEKQNQLTMIFHGLVASICMLSSAMSFAGFVFSGGISELLIQTGWFISSVGMLGIDGLCFWEALKKGEPAYRDKVVMMLMGILMTSGLVLGSIVSGGTLPLFVIAIMGAVWLIMSGYSYYRWSQNPSEREDF
jgi:hypothetical protein